jgi:hypothetical protein
LLDPGQTAETDIIIRIPNDERHLGGRYIVRIHPQSTAPRGAGPGLAFSVALLCDLRLEIAPRPPTPEEIRQLRRQKLGGRIEVKVTPERIFLSEIPLGRKVDIRRKFGDSIKIINTSDFHIDASINSLPVEKAGLFPPTGYEEAPDPTWLRVRRNRVRVSRNSVAEIPLTIKIPKDKSNLDRNFYFVVAVDVVSEIRNVRHLVKVYAETVKE